MLSRQPNNVVGCYVIIQARFFGNGGSFAKPKFGSWIMGLAAKDAKIAKNM